MQQYNTVYTVCRINFKIDEDSFRANIKAKKEEATDRKEKIKKDDG